MIQRPTSPNADDLIGANWLEIDEVALLDVAKDFGDKALAASGAHAQAAADSAKYHALLPEGFDNQVAAIDKVGGMAESLAGYFAACAGEVVAAGMAVGVTKTSIVTTVAVAEAVIAAARIEIASLQPFATYPTIALRIEELHEQIESTKSTGRTDIEALYNGTFVPVAPPPPALQPLTLQASPPQSPAPPSSAVSGSGLGAPESSDAVLPGFTAPQGSIAPKPAISVANTTGSPATQQVGLNAPQAGNAPQAAPAPNAPQGSSAAPAAPPSSQAASGVGSGSSVPAAGNAVPQAPSVAGPSSSASSSASLPSSGIASGGSGGGATSSAGPATGGPASTAVPAANTTSSTSSAASGAPRAGAVSAGPSAQPQASASAAAGQAPPQSSALPAAAPAAAAPGVASAASSASSAAFRPPAESTVSSSPVQGSNPAATPAGQPGQAGQAGQAVPATSAPSAATPGASAVAGAAGNVAGPAAAAGGIAPAVAPLVPPPPAGVPNAPAASLLPGSPGAVGIPGGSGGTPLPPPHVITSFGGRDMVSKLVRMGAHSVGSGISSTPEFTAATALTAALHDPVFGLVEWACAVFQNPGEMPRFVIASREGLSWIPSGLYMPDGVILAHLDPSIDWSVRKTWRGLRPPARVLGHYARIIGEEPQVVVARRWIGLDGLFSPRTVVVADDRTPPVEPNPLLNPAGRHRLELASPEIWWPLIQKVSDGEVAQQIVSVATHVAQSHDAAFGVDPLRRAAVESIGRAGADHVWQQVAERMFAAQADVVTMPVDAPEPLPAGWNSGLVAAEQMLRGWEALWLAQREGSRETLADMTYAAVAATV